MQRGHSAAAGTWPWADLKPERHGCGYAPDALGKGVG